MKRTHRREGREKEERRGIGVLNHIGYDGEEEINHLGYKPMAKAPAMTRDESCKLVEATVATWRSEIKPPTPWFSFFFSFPFPSFKSALHFFPHAMEFAGHQIPRQSPLNPSIIDSLQLNPPPRRWVAVGRWTGMQVPKKKKGRSFTKNKKKKIKKKKGF